MADVQRKCLNCGRGFVGKSNKKFCNRDCKSFYNHHKPEEKKCLTCKTLFTGTHKTKYCCEECRLLGKDKQTRQTNLKRYGCEYSQQNKMVREKGKKTCLYKYGVEYSRQAKEVKDRIKKTNLKKYGVEYPRQCKEIMDKVLESTKKTCLKKYGVPYNCMTKQCLDASTTISQINLDFISMLERYNIKCEREFCIGYFSYDIKVGNTLIEINPFPYHNSTWAPNVKNASPKAPDYHYNKLKLARDNGYRCIMIRDWDDYAKIPYLLEENKTNLYARKCEVREISREECHQFFEDYHLQGDTVKNKNNIYIGLYYNNELVECMSFGKPRYNKNYEREILRLCSHKDYKIIGGANKIFKHFLDITQTSSVISYCDMSKFDGGVYEQLGFKLLKWNKPSKHWYNDKEIPSRRHITDNFLRQRGYDQIFGESYGKGTDNDELMRQRGYVEIYDCGQSTFVWTR